MKTLAFNRMGGKARLAPWICSLMPEHRVYVEPFCGSAAVLLMKKPSHIEVINDIDEGVVNFFRVVRDPEKAAALARAVMLTPFSRVEFEGANLDHDDDVESARRFLVKNRMGYGSQHGSFVTAVDESYPNVWAGIPNKILATAQRLKNCVVECSDALDLIDRYDKKDTLFYLDPPYLMSGRSSSHKYKHELNDEDHMRMIEHLNNLKDAKYILSGYPTELYEHHLNYKHACCSIARTHVNSERIEKLWMNFQPQGVLDL